MLSHSPTPELNQRFGRAIRHLREHRGWSQEKLAEAADLNRSYLGEIERGSASPSLVTVVKLANALDLSAGDLVARSLTPGTPALKDAGALA